MLTIALAYLLNHPAAGPAVWTATAALESARQAQIERTEKAARLGAWLDTLDTERSLAIDHRANPFESDAKASPFANDDLKPDPFDQPPRLFWWATK